MAVGRVAGTLAADTAACTPAGTAAAGTVAGSNRPDSEDKGQPVVCTPGRGAVRRTLGELTGTEGAASGVAAWADRPQVAAAAFVPGGHRHMLRRGRDKPGVGL